MEVLKGILDCLTGRDGDCSQYSTGCCPSTGVMLSKRRDCLAADIVFTMFASEKRGQSLKEELDNLVHTEGWYENFAKRVLNHLISALKKPQIMGEVMKDAFDNASSTAKEFVRKHPIYAAAIITIIAIGILVLLTPWIVEVLGFGELGPVEGKQFADT